MQVSFFFYFATVFDCEWLRGLTRAGADRLDLFEHIVSSNQLTEDSVCAIEPVSRTEGNEELAAVGVGACIGHAEQSSLIVLDVEVFVGELGSVDGDSACSVVVREVTALGHEILDHSVEGAALVRVLLLVVAGTKRSEVLSGLRHIIRIQLKIIVVARGAWVCLPRSAVRQYQRHSWQL